MQRAQRNPSSQTDPRSAVDTASGPVRLPPVRGPMATLSVEVDFDEHLESGVTQVAERSRSHSSIAPRPAPRTPPPPPSRREAMRLRVWCSED